MIKQIQTDTKDAVASMDNGTNRVSEGKNLAQQAGDALKDIIDNTTKVNEAIMQWQQRRNNNQALQNKLAET
jgi:methyl-accepting chemotaxis protein